MRMRWSLSLVVRAMKALAIVLVPAALAIILIASPLGPRLLGGGQYVVEVLSRRVTTARLSAPVVVERLQALNRLETARQVSHQVVEVKSSSPLLGDFLSRDELVMTAQTEVVAGIDLERLSEDDVAVDGTKVTVRLPPAEVFFVHLDDNNTKVHVRQRGLLLLNPDKDLERRARLEATKSARQAAMESRILETARANAETNLRGLLTSLGFGEVTFGDPKASGESAPPE